MRKMFHPLLGAVLVAASLYLPVSMYAQGTIPPATVIHAPLVMDNQQSIGQPAVFTPTPMPTVAASLDFSQVTSRTVASALNYLVAVMEDGDELNDALTDFPTGSLERAKLLELGTYIASHCNGEIVYGFRFRSTAYGRKFILSSEDSQLWWKHLEDGIHEQADLGNPPIRNVAMWSTMKTIEMAVERIHLEDVQ